MNLHQIKLTQFRNYQQETISFHPKFTLLTGDNGAGKTSILEAVYYLCIGKSCFASLDKQIILHDMDFFRIEGRLIDQNDQIQDIVIKNKLGQKKEILISNKKLTTLQDYVGKFPCVIIAPDDVYTLFETSETRRNFINNTIVQSDSEYLSALMQYTQLLKQRNALLKQIQERKYSEPLLLDTLTHQLEASCVMIHHKRIEVIDALNPLFSRFYSVLSGGKESAKIRYESQLFHSEYKTLMQQNLDKDRILGRTNAGIHKDDLLLLMDDKPIKLFGSQGQLKSFVLAIKLAQYAYLKTIKADKPFLLLDDIFDKLDQTRVRQLLQILSGDGFGQVVITDTQSERIVKILEDIRQNYTIFVIEKGKAIGQT
ncbi:MAG: DNA replication and repair protein RecF [Saprospiraceae bacterium]